MFEGSELPTKEAVKYTRRLGELVYRERIHVPRPGRSLMLAILLADDRETYVIPALDKACVVEVIGGVLIEGTEINPRGRGIKNIKSDNYPQRWFCRPVGRPAAADPKGSRNEGRWHAEAIAAALQRRPTRRGSFRPEAHVTDD